ncbi:MAG: DUF4395 domain-containing protein [Prevotellaceae bacterium]|jgi:hypothetical protein|nr:DUF4395 domain-containing protein [Prevotellaceae bacterium]
MTSYKPVSIPKGAFIFCRYGIAALVWISFFLQSKSVLIFVCLIFLLSVILKIKRAPMIWFYSVTFDKIKKSADVLVDENAMRFAHTLGFLLSAGCLSAVTLIHCSGAWYAVLAFALLKTVSAVGFCPASKLYDCMLNGNCCVKRRKNGTYPSCQ